MNAAIPVVRGCGSRVKGGLYAELGLSSDGAPLEEFLLCPPLLIDVKALGVTSVGTKMIQRGATWHILDMVGEEHYKNVADYIEETRRFGMSRRLARNLDFSKLTDGSRMLLLHRRAFVTNFTEFDPHWVYTETSHAKHPFPRCPKCIAAHDQEDPPVCCAGVFWQDVEGGNPVPGKLPRRVERVMPSFSYPATQRPEGLEPNYQPAVFASFPISRIVAIEGTAKENERNKKVLSEAKLPTAFETE